MTHRAFWVACAVTGALVLVSCVLPLARIGLEGGDLHPRETIRMLTLGTAGSIGVIAAGLALVGVAVAGLRFGARGPAILALVAAVVAFSQGERSAAYSTPDGGILCTDHQVSDGDCGGPVFGPELADLYARQAPPPTTADAQAEELGYRADPRSGLWLLFGAPVPLIFWAAYRAARLRIRSRGIAVALVAVLGLFFTLLVLAHLAFANYYD